MLRNMKNVLRDEKGTTFIESVLWISLFVLVVAVAVKSLATATTGVIQDMVTKITAD